MGKPTLLYGSPFAPQQSGISAYSAALVQGLGSYFEVTLLTGDYYLGEADVAIDFPRVRWGRDRVDPRSFDHRIYNIGNHPMFHGFLYECALRHPGTVILHDVVLYFLVVGYYRDRPDFYTKLYELGGPEAVALVKAEVKAGRDLLQFSHPERLPLNGELLRGSERIVVHSAHAVALLRGLGSLTAPVVSMPLVSSRQRPTPVKRSVLLARYGLPEDSFIVASFGFIAPVKRNHLVCDVVDALAAEGCGRACYVMVGDGGYVDTRLGARIVKTGYVGEPEFDAWIEHADLVVNLRSRSMGETSAALLRVLSWGRPCVVSDIGWFAELPGEVIFRVDNDNAGVVVERLVRDGLAGRLPRRVDEAGRYVALHHSEAAVARQLYDLVTNTRAPRIMVEPADAGGAIRSAWTGSASGPDAPQPHPQNAVIARP